MAVNELTLPTWNTLNEKRQRFIFQQLTRYFLSPLLTVDVIRPVTATFYGQTLHTFEAMIGGEWVRLVPGMTNVSLGFATNQQEELAPYLAQSGLTLADIQQMLSPVRKADMPAMLVATRATPANEEILGRVSLTTRIFKGNHMAYAAIRAQVLALLDRHGSLDPFSQTGWPATLTSGSVKLRLASAHHYQVSIVKSWRKADLSKSLSYFGFRLPTQDQYEYLQSGGNPSLFPFGNTLPLEMPRYLPNRFGLTIPVKRTGSELIVEDLQKSTALTAQPTAKEALALSPFYQVSGEVDMSSAVYRRVATITVN
ncbi:hypothetical protein LACPH_000712 [Lacticaseibacillus parahuelsenbergensis]|uniref:Uncharacterized protein n=1 Tax=Lacticaseibacillus parahuelsenbergensis TaxID=3068305 RepID=A0ABY9L4S0_9LACO|nr:MULTISPECIES: hypothetical protein [Lacticaseibacillus]MDE3281801.1 hypothetical protein [Lacticaseibacillus casei]WLV78732.1 hypothetical protein LACPH_000712 [Lacticaseibacillus sp. NCIMB 15471]